MRTDSLLVVSALLTSAAIPAFAQSHQEEIICRMTGGSCIHEEKAPEVARLAATTSYEYTRTMERTETEIRDRLHGSAYVRAEMKPHEDGMSENVETLEQRQDYMRTRLHGDAPR